MSAVGPPKGEAAGQLKNVRYRVVCRLHHGQLSILSKAPLVRIDDRDWLIANVGFVTKADYQQRGLEREDEADTGARNLAQSRGQ